MIWNNHPLDGALTVHRMYCSKRQLRLAMNLTGNFILFLRDLISCRLVLLYQQISGDTWIVYPHLSTSILEIPVNIVGASVCFVFPIACY